jgi:hypothetical protein
MDHVITCPGCGKPLHVPGAAVGKSAHCPHCQAAFGLTPTPGGPPAVRPARPLVPRRLILPAVGLLTLGLAGVVVNGIIAARCQFEPGFADRYARATVWEERAIDALGSKQPDTPFMAAAGPGPVAVVRELLDGQLAAARVPRVGPLAWRSLLVSAVTLAGGLAVLAGRLFPLALLGCLAAMVNFNHNCFIPGLLVGVWGVVMLVRDDVREHFRRL